MTSEKFIKQGLCPTCKNSLKDHRRCMGCRILLHNRPTAKTCGDEACYKHRIKLNNARRKGRNVTLANCEFCGKQYKKRCWKQKYCGSYDKKRGCSYKVRLLIEKARHEARKNNKIVVANKETVVEEKSTELPGVLHLRTLQKMGA